MDYICFWMIFKVEAWKWYVVCIVTICKFDHVEITQVSWNLQQEKSVGTSNKGAIFKIN